MRWPEKVKLRPRSTAKYRRRTRGSAGNDNERQTQIQSRKKERSSVRRSGHGGQGSALSDALLVDGCGARETMPVKKDCGREHIGAFAFLKGGKRILDIDSKLGNHHSTGMILSWTEKLLLHLVNCTRLEWLASALPRHLLESFNVPHECSVSDGQEPAPGPASRSRR